MGSITIPFHVLCLGQIQYSYTTNNEYFTLVSVSWQEEEDEHKKIYFTQLSF